MKTLSLLFATLLLASCAGMQGGYETSGSSAQDIDYTDDAYFATMPGMYRGDPTKSLYFGE